MSAILVVTPSHLCNPWLAIAAVRAQETGILDLGYRSSADVQRAAVETLGQHAGKSRNWGVRWDALGDRARDPAVLKELLFDIDCPILLLAGLSGTTTPWRETVEQARSWAGQILAEVYSVAEAEAAEEAGFDGIIVKGIEAGGRVSRESSFMLLQRLHGRLSIPYWIQGGIGLDTATAAWLSGAAGIVLAEQLWLAAETPFDQTEQLGWSQTRGTAATLLSADGLNFRFHAGPATEALQARTGDEDWPSLLRERLASLGNHQQLIPLGQDIAFAPRLADNHVNVAGILAAYRKRSEENLLRARRDRALGPGGPLAKSIGAHFPILQTTPLGANCVAAFAESVATAGGLPFVASAPPAELKQRLGNRHWGICGDASPESLDSLTSSGARLALLEARLVEPEQIDQLRRLEQAGIDGFLRVACPAQLSRLLAAGARRFVFDAGDCADEPEAVSSFWQWQSLIDVLAAAEVDNPEDVHAVFAGGIHDALSAAMVAAIAAPLTAKDMKIGVLLSSGYLFTHEAVETGLISQDSQREVLAGGFESAEINGHADRRRAQGCVAQAAGLRAQTLSVAALHDDVSAGSVALLERLATRRFPWHRTGDSHKRKTDDIAVIGMSCMFPKANDLRQYWQNIFNRVDAIEEVPAERWDADKYFDPDRFAPDRVYSKWGGFIGKVTFDPMKWRIPPASLRSIEPIQLLSLDVAAKAMADAGYDKRDFPRERAGVIFAAAGSHELGSGYAFRTMMRHYLPMAEGLSEAEREKIFASLEEQLPEWTEDSFPGFLLNVIAGRIARELNLNGPNYVVDAACAASLAALHAAIEQLRMGTSDMMLVGGADATNNPFCYMCFSKTHALSPRGHSHPFDDGADGIALGEGIAVIVLKRLADAERDGDRIYAVIKGIGSSSDGKNRSLTAPHPPGQAKAVERAYEDAQISPATISLVEAHGTGTAVGDGAELTTLSQVFNEYTERKQYVAVGSVKSMIGHTKTVAGVASLIKAVLALKHGVLPATIGVEKPTERIDFNASPFYLNTETRPWLDELGGEPRRAAVSAFGFGGTNFHVVLEEYQGAFHPNAQLDLSPRAAEAFLWRRSTRDEIVTALETLQAQLAELPTEDLALLANSVHADQAQAEAASACRLGIVATSVSDFRLKLGRALTQLKTSATINDPTGVYYSEAAPVSEDQICFLYPGQGSQQVNMLRDLAITNRWADDLFSRANSLLADFLPEPISRYIYPPPTFGDDEKQEQFQALSETRIAQPALGIIELFSTELLRRYGVRPGKVAGHSYGELVALHVAGCIDERELLWLSAMRGKVCSEVAHAAPGGMAAVRADAKTTLHAMRELGLDLHLANMNAPDQTVVGGTESQIAAAIEKFPTKGIKISRLPVSAAFHTPLLAAGSEAMAVHFGLAEFKKPGIPVYSNTTGEIHGDNPAIVRELLTQHFSEPVQFEKEIHQLYEDGARVFVEAGPGKVLTSLVSRILPNKPHTALSLDAAGREGWTQLGHLLSQCVALGLPVDLTPWYEGRALRQMSVADFCDYARSLANPKRSDWIVGPAKSEPVTPLPARKSDGSALRAKFGMKAAPAEAAKSAAASPAESRPAVVAPKPAAAPAPAPLAQPATIAAAVPVAPPQPLAAAQPVPVSPVAAAAPIAPVSLGNAKTSLTSPASPVRQLQWGGSLPTNASTLRDGLIPSVVYPNGNASLSGLSQLSPTTLQRTVTTMSHHSGDPAPTGQAPIAVNPGVELLTQFQATTRSLLDFQTSQQHVVARFLDMQERMLAYCLGGAVPISAAPVAAPQPQPLPQAIVSVPTAPVAPAPVAAAPIAAPAPIRVAPAPAPVRAPVAVPAVSAPAVRPAAPAPVAVPVAKPAPVAAAPVAAAPTAPQNGQAVAKAAPAGGPPSIDEFRNDLLEIVSERTGYPVDMLDVTLPLEAGLGIDSIKTVEIFSNLKKYHEYFADEDQDEEEQLVEFTKLKTLKDIIDSYDRRRQAVLAKSGSLAAPAAKPAAEHLNGQANGKVDRYSVSTAEAPLDADSEKKNSLTAT